MFGTNIRIARLFGISINVDLSWVIAFVLITWSLGGHYFPAHHSAWSSRTYWGVAVLTSVLFFTSLLVHELAHSLVARRFGIAVRDITLFIFGGVARMEAEPVRPRDDLLIALAGPAASLGLAAAFGTLWWLAPSTGSPLHALSGWLALINLVMAVFNMLPGFPLDGGRVLRAAVWSFTGSESRATRVAAGVGRVIGLALIFWGLWQVFVGAWGNGVWIALIGWFLHHAATASAAHAALEDLLVGHTAREVMLTDSPSVPRLRTLDMVVDEVVLLSGHRCFPVIDGERFFGLLTVEQIKAVPREQWPFMRVEDVMTPRAQVQIARPDDALIAVLDRMDETGVNQLPVLDEDRFVGMLAREHVLAIVRIRSELDIERSAA